MKKMKLQQLSITSFLTNADMIAIDGGVPWIISDESDAPGCVHSRLGNCLLVTHNCY